MSLETELVDGMARQLAQVIGAYMFYSVNDVYSYREAPVKKILTYRIMLAHVSAYFIIANKNGIFCRCFFYRNQPN